MSTTKSFAGLNCLVLGGAGFLGHALSAALCDRGATVRGFGRISNPQLLDKRVIWTNATFGDISALARAIDGQHVVFHLLGSSIPESSNRDPAEDLLSGTYATIRMLDLCRTSGVSKILFASSGGTIYGIPQHVPTPESAPTDPISAYGINKLATEKYLDLYRRIHDLDYLVLRIANPYGPGQSASKKQGVVASIVHHAHYGTDFEIWGDGEVTRDFVHVRDVTEAFIKGIDYVGDRRVMNVGSGVGRSINGVISDVEGLLDGAKLRVIRKPGRTVDVPMSILDTTIIRRELAWAPTVDWIEGLRELVELQKTDR